MLVTVILKYEARVYRKNAGQQIPAVLGIGLLFLVIIYSYSRFFHRISLIYIQNPVDNVGIQTRRIYRMYAFYALYLLMARANMTFFSRYLRPHFKRLRSVSRDTRIRRPPWSESNSDNVRKQNEICYSRGTSETANIIATDIWDKECHATIISAHLNNGF